MLSEHLGLDEKDVIILNALSSDPSVSQAELAKRCKLSQPSVNVRIHKLKKRGVLAQSTGVEFNRTNMHLVRVDFSASKPSEFLKKLSKCSFFVNAFTMSGKQNISALIVGHSLTKIDTIVNEHIRSEPSVSNISTSVIVNTAKPFVCQLSFTKELPLACQDKTSCKNCPMH